MIYSIHKGNHRSRPLQIGFSFFKKSWKWQVQFTDSCKYTPDPEEDTNKLCGVGFLPGHHTNSARFGWRWKDGAIELSAYIYEKGVRTIIPMAQVDLNEMAELRLEDRGGVYEFHVNDKILVIYKLHRRKTTYRLGLYFGGNNPAPHDMKVLINRV